MSSTSASNTHVALTKLGITESELQTVSENSINSGASFLAGGATNAFAASGTGQFAGSIMNAAGAATELSNVAQAISQKCIQYITTEITSYAATCAVDIIAFDVGRVSYWTGVYMKEEMDKIIKEAKDSVTKDAEDIQDENENNAQQNQEKEAKEQSSNKAKEIAKRCDDALGKAAEKINSITALCSQGTDYLEKNLPKQVEKIVDDTKKSMSGQVESIQEKKEGMYKAMGKKAADMITGPVGRSTAKTAAKAKALVEKNKANVKAKGKSKAMAAIFKLRGLLGS